MVKVLWEIVKATACVILIVSLVKVAIEERFIKFIRNKKLKKEIKKATDSLIEELKKETEHKKCDDCKKSTKKPIKKTQKKEDK